MLERRCGLMLSCILIAAGAQVACSSERGADEAQVALADTGSADTGSEDAAAGFMDAYDAGFASHRIEMEKEADAAQALEDRNAFDQEFVRGFGALSELDVPGLATFVEADAEATLDRASARLGMPVQDLASSNALLMMAGWEAVHGREIRPSEATVILDQVRDILRRKPPAAYVTNEQEWRLARSYALLGAVLLNERARHQGNPDALARLRTVVTADFKRQTGMDMSAIEIGPGGFQ